MLTENQRFKLVASFRLVVPIAETAAELFYARLFELRPEYRSMFPDDMSGQRRKLVKMLAFVVRSLDFADADWRARIDESDDLFLVVLALGRRHSEMYRVTDDSYAPVGEALLWTLDRGLGEAFTPELKEAWAAIYSALAATMKLGRRAADPIAEVAT